MNTLENDNSLGDTNTNNSEDSNVNSDNSYLTDKGNYNKDTSFDSTIDNNTDNNPTTGTTMIILVWIIGVGSLIYTCFYLKKFSIVNGG